MAAKDPFSPRTSDDASVALLRGLRAGTVDSRYVHRIDVCSAAPEHLVADLDPVRGTDLADGGYNAVWFFYCPKRFKNAQGKPSGHRQRAIAGGDTCWHSETRPKPVKGLDGATLCNLSYGRKEEGSSRSFNRMGWYMTEYDDSHGGGGDHVLCKIYRSSSSLAKRKSKPAIEPLSGSKRKATSDNAQSLLPAKMSNCACADREVQVQQDTLVTQQSQQNTQSLFPTEGEPDWEQIEQDLQFLSQFDNTMFTIDELLGVPGYSEELISSCSGTPAIAPPDAGFSEGLAF